MAEMAIIGPLVPLIEKLLLAILDVKEKYKPELVLLKSTLESVHQRIQERRRLDGELDLPSDNLDKLIELLQKGEKLVKKCDEIPSLNYFKKYCYLKKILNLEQSLRDYFRINVTMDISHDVKRVRIDLNELTRKVEKWSLSGDLCSAPKILDRTVGLGVPIVEAKEEESLGDRGGGILSGDLCSVPKKNLDGTVGLDGPLVELKRELFREDVTVIGLCAPGGYGKTTLAAKLCHDKQVRDRFKENIFFVPVSRSPELEEIVKRLWGRLARGSQMPKILNEKDAFDSLGYLLKQRETEPVLLVLDDVWEKSVVQKFKFDFRIEGYKLLVTSREAFKTFESTYSLTTLSEKNAMALFKNIAFPQGGRDEYEKPGEALLDTIVKCCKRVPLALDVIARSLRLQPVQMWRSREEKLKSSSILNYNKDLLECLASSLDSLDDDTVRNCFLDLGSFREDQRIPASALIDIWVELYDELDEDDAYVNLLELSTKNLINLVEITSDAREIDGNANKLFVVQHDLLRDLAIYKSKQEQPSKRLIIHKGENGHLKRKREPDHSLSARLVSIHTGEMLSSSWGDMEFPEAEVLILNLSATEYALPPFMKKMEKLKVLIIVNHGYHHTKLSDLTTLGYLSHLKRTRLEKVWIPSLDEITKPLENLQKISLVMCEVGQAFKNCTVEIPKILPNLIDMEIDYCNDLVELPPGICDIIPLQKLSITNCHKLSALPVAIERMTHLEMLKLHACTELSELPGSIQRLQKLRCLDISDCLSITKLPEGMGELRGLEKLDMRHCLGVRELPRSTSDLGQLEKVICDEETASLWEPLRTYLSKLNIIVRADDKTLNWLGIDLHNFRS